MFDAIGDVDRYEFLHPCCVASAALVAAATTMVRPRGPIYCALRAPTPSGRTTVVIIKTVDWHLNSFGLSTVFRSTHILFPELHIS